MVGGFHVTAICETFKISCLMVGHQMKGGSEYHVTDQLSRLELWSNIILFLLRTFRDYINLIQKSCQVNSLDVRCTRWGGFWKGDIMVADIEEMEEMNASELHARRLNAKEVLTPMKGQKIIFPVADGRVKISGEDQDLRTPTFIRDSPDRGEEQGNLRGESDWSFSTPRQYSSCFVGESKSDQWSISGDFIYRHHVEPWVKLYVPTEESFPIPLKYIDVTRTADTILEVMSETHIDAYWNVDGNRNFRNAWTGFTRFNCIERETTWWIFMIREETDEETNDLKTRQCVARFVEADVCASKRKEKQKCTVDKPKPENARRLRGIFFIELDCEEFMRVMNNARRKLHIPTPAAMPCRLQLHQHRETCGTFGQHKTKYACIVEANGSTRIRMEGSQEKNHEDHTAEKRHEFIESLQSCAQNFPAPEAMKNTWCFGSSVGIMGKLEKIPAWQLTKMSETKKRWFKNQGMKAEKFILRRWWISVISKIRSWNHNFPKVSKVESCSEVTLLKMFQNHTQCLLNKDHQHQRWQLQKWWT